MRPLPFLAQQLIISARVQARDRKLAEPQSRRVLWCSTSGATTTWRAFVLRASKEDAVYTK